MHRAGFRRERPLTAADRDALSENVLVGAERRERYRTGYRILGRPLPPHLATNEQHDAEIIRTRGRVLWDESDHPRWPKGTWAGQGGEFRPKFNAEDGALLLAAAKKTGGRNRKPTATQDEASEKKASPTTPAADSPREQNRPRESDKKSPSIPRTPPRDPSERLRAVTRVARDVIKAVTILASRSPGARLARIILEKSFEDISWVIEGAWPYIQSYFDPPKTLEQLRENLHYSNGKWNCPPGYQAHHIVEQTQAAQDGEPPARIESRENVVCVPTFKHWEVTGWMMKSNEVLKDGDGVRLSPRQYLKRRTWEEKYRTGLDALRDKGVLR